MKKYRVSLALKIPSNFEIKVKAGTEKKALEKALEKYYDGEFDENNIKDTDWQNMELDINEKGNIHKTGNGVFIEKLK